LFFPTAREIVCLTVNESKSRAVITLRTDIYCPEPWVSGISLSFGREDFTKVHVSIDYYIDSTVYLIYYTQHVHDNPAICAVASEAPGKDVVNDFVELELVTGAGVTPELVVSVSLLPV